MYTEVILLKKNLKFSTRGSGIKKYPPFIKPWLAQSRSYLDKLCSVWLKHRF